MKYLVGLLSIVLACFTLGCDSANPTDALDADSAGATAPLASSSTSALTLTTQTISRIAGQYRPDLGSADSPLIRSLGSLAFDFSTASFSCADAGALMEVRRSSGAVVATVFVYETGDVDYSYGGTSVSLASPGYFSLDLSSLASFKEWFYVDLDFAIPVSNGGNGTGSDHCTIPIVLTSEGTSDW
ncbi:MAG: hypothetical protein AAF809_04945 [Bacteroidota bacterium]